MVDIFDEVEEELRAERTRRLLTRYGGVMIAAALLVVAAVGAWQGWRWWQARHDMAMSSQYLAAMRIADSASHDKAAQQRALTEFDRIASTAPTGYATLARLRAAALKAGTGDIGGAVKLWDSIAADPSVPRLLRDLASLLAAQHQVDSGDPGRVAAQLKALAEPDNPWHALAQEQLAVLDLRQGKSDAAKAELRRVAQDVTAPNGVRGRAAALLQQLGG